jgi:hypothetical protein
MVHNFFDIGSDMVPGEYQLYRYRAAQVLSLTSSVKHKKDPCSQVCILMRCPTLYSNAKLAQARCMLPVNSKHKMLVLLMLKQSACQ